MFYDYKIEVYNSIGQIIYFGDNVENIDTGNWKNGVYFIKIINREAIETYKIVRSI